MFLWDCSSPSTAWGVGALHDYGARFASSLWTSNCGLDNASWRKSKAKWSRGTHINWVTQHFGFHVQRNIKWVTTVLYYQLPQSSIRISLNTPHWSFGSFISEKVWVIYGDLTTWSRMHLGVRTVKQQALTHRHAGRLQAYHSPTPRSAPALCHYRLFERKALWSTWRFLPFACTVHSIILVIHHIKDNDFHLLTGKPGFLKNVTAGE